VSDSEWLQTCVLKISADLDIIKLYGIKDKRTFLLNCPHEQFSDQWIGRGGSQI